MSMTSTGLRPRREIASPPAHWNREERTKPRDIAGLARFFKGCGVPISDRYMREAIKVGGYQPEFGNLTTADHFLKWKGKAHFVCRFKKKAEKSGEPARPSRRPARSTARADRPDE